MIDTVKIAVPYDQRPAWYDDMHKNTSRGKGGAYTAVLQPKYKPQVYKASDVYVPRLYYIERRNNKLVMQYTLYIELSLPKLYFGNNFSELTDDLFLSVVLKLSKQIQTIYGIQVLPSAIEKATLSKIDYSKNIVFTDRTPVSMIINTLETADVPKTYDMQKTIFKNGGQILHVHANSIDVVMYDKIADLRQSKMSELRSYEDDNYVQVNLLDEFDKHPNVTVPRWEIRLNNKRKIRQELKAVGADIDLRFSYLFSSDISSKVLLRHWQKIIDQIPPATTNTTATQILLAYKQTDPEMKFAKASALTLLQLLRNEAQGERAVRNIIEGLFGTAQYYRLKDKTRKASRQTERNELLRITEIITEMEPVSVDDFLQ